MISKKNAKSWKIRRFLCIGYFGYFEGKLATFLAIFGRRPAIFRKTFLATLLACGAVKKRTISRATNNFDEELNEVEDDNTGSALQRRKWHPGLQFKKTLVSALTGSIAEL